MAMQMLYLHWRGVRMGLIPFVIAAFGLPLLMMQGANARGAAISDVATMNLLGGMEGWLPLFPMLAAGIGFTLALAVWNQDHKGNHVYALSLPVARWEYALLKFGAGVVLALVPVVALFAGSLVAILAVDLPAGIHAYPFQMTGRFLFTVLVTYAVLFSMAAGTIRTTVIVLSALFGLPILLSMGLEALSGFVPILGQVDVAETIFQGLLDFGPFRIMAGDWMLFDV